MCPVCESLTFDDFLIFIVNHGNHLKEFKKSKRKIFLNKISTSGYVKEVDISNRKKTHESNKDSEVYIGNRKRKHENNNNEFDLGNRKRTRKNNNNDYDDDDADAIENLDEIKRKYAKYQAVKETLNKYMIAYTNLSNKYTKIKDQHEVEKKNYSELLQKYNKTKVQYENTQLEVDRLSNENQKIKKLLKSKENHTHESKIGFFYFF